MKTILSALFALLFSGIAGTAQSIPRYFMTNPYRIHSNVEQLVDSLLRNAMIESNAVQAGRLILMYTESEQIIADSGFSKVNGDVVPDATAVTCFEPGTLIYPLIISSAVKDGHITLLDSIPTNGGMLLRRFPDRKIASYEQRTGKKTITIQDGLHIDSQYIPEYVSEECYFLRSQQFLEHVAEYNTALRKYFSSSGSIPERGTMIQTKRRMITLGYGLAFTPEEMLAFYTSLAKSRELSKALPLIAVTDSSFEIAGKTGTTKPHYSETAYTASYAGFFPVENPVLSVICVLVAKPGDPLYGGDTPRSIVRNLAVELLRLQD